jgi:hypothetical protein
MLLFYSVLEEKEGQNSLAHQSAEASSSTTSAEYRERQKKLLEAQRKAKEERKKIAEQVKFEGGGGVRIVNVNCGCVFPCRLYLIGKKWRRENPSLQ